MQPTPDEEAPVTPEPIPRPPISRELVLSVLRDGHHVSDARRLRALAALARSTAQERRRRDEAERAA